MSVDIQVLFFGAIAEIVGVRELNIAVTNGSTSADILERLKGEYSGLLSQKLIFAVNEEYKTLNTVLKSGDQVAIFTPVSGG